MRSDAGVEEVAAAAEMQWILQGKMRTIEGWMEDGNPIKR
jgi:hypothetical protein